MIENMETDPDLRLIGFSLWVDGRESLDSTDNWLRVRAEMRANGAHVECSGPILMVTDIEQFRDDLSQMFKTLTGEATLTGFEHGIKLHLQMQTLGRIDAFLEITPDHWTQQHRFVLDVDQSYLASLVASCEDVLARLAPTDLP